MPLQQYHGGTITTLTKKFGIKYLGGAITKMEQSQKIKLFGDFHLEFVSISWVINHMTCYNFECSHWWKIHLEKILYKVCSPV